MLSFFLSPLDKFWFRFYSRKLRPNILIFRLIFAFINFLSWVHDFPELFEGISTSLRLSFSQIWSGMKAKRFALKSLAIGSLSYFLLIKLKRLGFVLIIRINLELWLMTCFTSFTWLLTITFLWRNRWGTFLRIFSSFIFSPKKADSQINLRISHLTPT